MRKNINTLLILSIITILISTTFSVIKFYNCQTTEIINEKTEFFEKNSRDFPKINNDISINTASEGFSKISQLDVDFGNAYKIEKKTASNIIYVAGLSGGVTFIDTSSPTNPIVLGNYWNGGIIYDVDYVTTYCYLACYDKGIEVISTEDYGEVVSLNTFYDGGEAYDVELLGSNVLYVAVGTKGLEIFNIRDNKTNFLKVFTDDFGATKITGISADPLHNIVFLMAGDDGVIVLDITRPFSPVYLRSIKDGTSDSHDADVNAYNLYIADGINGLRVFNYRDQDNITSVGNFSISPGESARFVKWDTGRKLYLSTSGNDNLYLLNITTLSNITIRQIFSYAPGSPYSMATSSNTLYLANYYDFKILNVINPDSPVISSSIIFAGEPSSTTIFGTTGVLTEGLTGFILIDLNDLTNPILLSKYIKEGVSFYETRVNNSKILYCATSIGLEIVNITYKNNPTFISSLSIGRALAIEYSNNIVYLIVVGVGLVTIDVTNPNNPVQLDSLTLAAKPRDLFINSTYAFVSVGTFGFSIIDISDPEDLLLVKTHDTINADGLYIDGTILALADRTSGVKLYNISDFDSIQLLDSILTTGYNVTRLVISGDEIFVAATEDGLYKINASNVTNISLTAHFSDGGSNVHLTVNNSIIYVADTINSFEVIGNDLDFDRLSDYVENLYWETDPNIADTDSDGIWDGDEVDYWTDRDINPKIDFDSDNLSNILDFDSDNDTISDGIEVNYWDSDPNNLDTDDDLLSDELEVNVYLTHPAKSDTDDDELSDYQEIKGIYQPTNPLANATGYIFTNATNPDTDYDVPYDGWEIDYNFNPLIADSYFDNDSDLLNSTMEFLYDTDPFDDDSDDDGLTDSEEVLTYLTNPNSIDTDNDGIDDNFEVNNGLDPNDDADGKTDEDNDGLTNYEEYFWGTDLYYNDTDDDGMLDKWEVYQGTNPFFNDTLLDYDDDSLTNYQEYLYGTDPRDSDTDDDGWLDSIEIDSGTDPLDPTSHPPKTTITPTIGIEFIIFVGLSFIIASIFLIKKYKK